MKVLKEWFVTVPWGKIALISWGTSSGPPVLLVHGRQDSAATFIPLMELLPETNHYVAIDLPGHGRSDPLPYGVMVSRVHFIGAVELVLQHLKWTEFVYIGHSMGSEQGMFYNAAYPRRISKLVLLDAGPSFQRLQVHDPAEYMERFYDHYYTNYGQFKERKLYSKQQIIQSVMKARGFTEAQAEIVLSRNLTKVGEDLYQLSWDRRLRFPAPQNYPTEYYRQLWSRDAPPTLLVAAKQSSEGYKKGEQETKKLISDMEKSLDHFFIVSVDGGHDVHFTNPERFVKELCGFLDKKFEAKSKL